MFDSPRMIFDPGIYGLMDVDADTLDALAVVSELFEVAYPGHMGECPVITQGELQLAQCQVIEPRDTLVVVDKILFDSGAMQASYISKDWIEEHRHLIQGQLRPCAGRVKLADNKTIVGVNERFRTLVSFTVRGTGEVVSGMVDFWVLAMPGPGSISAIIGLPDIVKTFLRVFQHMLEDAAEMAQEGLYLGHMEDVATEIHLLRSMTLDELRETYPDVQDSWSRPMDEIAPEELETEEACSFTGPLYYLSKPYEEVREEYFSMFDKHIAPEWRHHPRLVELLNSEKARLVFTPEAWHGINGIELDFDFADDMPTVHRNRSILSCEHH